MMMRLGKLPRRNSGRAGSACICRSFRTGRIHRLDQVDDQDRQQSGCHYHRRAADRVQQPTEHGKHTPLEAFAIQSPDSHVLPLRRHRTNLYAQFILAAEGNRADSAFQHLPGPVLQQVAHQGGLLDLHIVTGLVQQRV